MDIRSRPREEWGRLLRERWPRPMSATLGWTAQQGSAVTCVIIVMKMVISYTDDVLRHGGSQLEWVKAEERAEEHNVLLKYAWHDTSEGVEGTAVLRLQEEVYKELMDREGRWARAVSEGITFEGLMESVPMWKHFWSRPEFRMRAGFEVERKDGWAPIQRVLRPDNVNPVSPTDLAKQSLVRWASDGTTLQSRLARRPVRNPGQGPSFVQVQGWSRGRQECLRVLYDAKAGEKQPGFKDLAGLALTPDKLEVGEQSARWVKGVELKYRLIATVRLGSPEYIRTYDKAGQYGVPRALSSQAVLCLDNEWKLGEPGSKYMLYYVLVRSTDIEQELGDEVPPSLSDRGLARAVDLQQASSGGRKDPSPPPQNAPTEPRADRQRDLAAAHPQVRSDEVAPVWGFQKEYLTHLPARKKKKKLPHEDATATGEPGADPPPNKKNKRTEDAE